MQKKIMKLFLAVVLVSALYFVAGCNKSEQNEQVDISEDIKPLKKIKQIRVSGFDYHHEQIIDYSWDGDYLIKVDSYFSGSDESSSYSLTYDGGKLISMIKTDNSGSQSRWSYIYEGNILVADTQITNWSTGSSDTYIRNYYYTNGKISSILDYSLHSWGDYTRNITFKWNGDNVVEIDNFIGESIGYTYDNNPNPLRQHLSMNTILDCGFFEVGASCGWSKNNVVKMDISEGGNTASGSNTYEYDSDGYPISITVSSANDETLGTILITYY